MKYEIKFDDKECMGCGACTRCDNWEINDEGKAYPKITEMDDVGCNEEAAEVCPIDIIKIIKK